MEYKDYHYKTFPDLNLQCCNKLACFASGNVPGLALPFYFVSFTHETKRVNMKQKFFFIKLTKVCANEQHCTLWIH
jgi:hypothetical protein